MSAEWTWLDHDRARVAKSDTVVIGDVEISSCLLRNAMPIGTDLRHVLVSDMAFRRAAECRIASFAAIRADAAEKQAMLSLHNMQFRAALDGDVRQVIDLDVALEDVIATAGDHPVLGSKLRQRKAAFRSAWIESHESRDITATIGFRTDLIDAIGRGDPYAAHGSITEFFQFLSTAYRV
jgi:DNA-binding FadR family transcriptional regulator